MPFVFKPDRENQAFLFDRMSESYAMLFMSIPINRKDVFIQVSITFFHSIYAN